MRTLRLCLIVVFGAALAVTGTLPPEHLHHTGATRPQVHSHLAYAGEDAGAGHDGANLDGDGHHRAVEIERFIAAGPRPICPNHTATPTASASLLPPQVVVASVPSPVPEEAASPPPRPSAPRAPPA